MNSRIRSNVDQNKKNKTNNFRPLALAIAMAVGGSLPSVSQAATFTVTNTNDSGTGSLRQAVFLANTTPEADFIEFSVASGSTINLATEINITDAITISGPTAGEANSIIIDAGGLSRHFNASTFQTNSNKSIILENITLTRGYTNLGNGGSIVVENANVILNHSDISNNINNTYGDVFSPNFGGGISIINGDLTLNHSTISRNIANKNAVEGGGISVKNGTLTLNQSTVSKNQTMEDSSPGGGIRVSGELNLIQSTISGNKTNGTAGTGSWGGGFFTSGSEGLFIFQSTISGNSSQNQGGGFFHSGDDVIINQSTISNNTSSRAGGGFYSSSNNLSITQSTISGNKTTGNVGRGGGFFAQNGISGASLFELSQSTITNNSSIFESGGIQAFFNTINISNSIISGNTGPFGNFYGASNVTVNTSLFADPLTEIDINNGAYFDPSNDPKLGPLQHNGGLTQTHKPLAIATSQILDTANNTNAASFINDQRGTGFPRIHNTNVDMGAVELQNNPLAGDPPLNIHEVLTRRDMAREMLKAIEGVNYQPPAAEGLDYDDVNIGDVNADWIEEFTERGFTEGCDGNNYCPDMVVTKEAMAKVFVKAKGFTPPYNVNSSAFEDMPNGTFAWEEASLMFNNGWSEGCSSRVDFSQLPPVSVFSFCPKEPVTREWFNTLLSQLP